MRRAFETQDVTIYLSGAGSSTTVGSAGITIRQTAGTAALIEERIRLLEINLYQIETEIHERLTAVDQEANKLSTLVRSESELHGRAEAELRRGLEDATTGNYAVLIFGAIWLAIEVVLAGWAPEITKIAAGKWTEVLISL